MLDDSSNAMEILLSDKSSEFEAHTLDLLDLHEKVSTVGDAAFVERLVVPRVKFEGLMYWDQVSIVFDRLKEFSDEMADQFSASPADRIYISRSDAKRRPMSNEKEIEAELARDGYEIVSFTGMPLWKQFFIASSAREIVAPHGAGLAHLIMCKPGTKVTEIVPVSDGTHKLRFNYARLSLVRGHDYRAWLEPQLGEGDSWSVDAGAFLEFLRQRD
jgi:capsular polysaccharide biosynthesis protein